MSTCEAEPRSLLGQRVRLLRECYNNRGRVFSAGNTLKVIDEKTVDGKSFLRLESRSGLQCTVPVEWVEGV